jgi:CheY-like chemotaxis protein
MESIGMLAGGIAHDLNNVLAPIVMATQLLRLRFPDAESQKLLGTVEASAQRGAELVRQVLTFARGLEGQHLLVHPKALVRDVERLLAETVGKSIEVVSQIEPDLWPVPGDPTQLHQVLMNLCINARDAMPEGGRLRIGVRNVRVDEQYAAMSQELRPGLYVLFEVQDTGHGVPPEIRERIFEPFFSTKKPGKGTGLGLSTARTIVRNHDGVISLESEMGRGTTFRVFLPASLETATARGTAAPLPPPRGSGETILVVDDEASILSITRHALEMYGYQALTASNGAEALALFAQKRGAIAAVLTDMAMPVLDGAALIYALRKIDPDVKVIAASGLKSTVQSMEPFGLGTTAFLAKPFTAETMLHAIHAALASRAPASVAAAARS